MEYRKKTPYARCKKSPEKALNISICCATLSPQNGDEIRTIASNDLTDSLQSRNWNNKRNKLE